MDFKKERCSGTYKLHLFFCSLFILSQLSQIFVANSTSHTISSYAMDAIFTLALALNDTLPVDFNVTYSLSYDTLLLALKESSFLGASVSFNNLCVYYDIKLTK